MIDNKGHFVSKLLQETNFSWNIKYNVLEYLQKPSDPGLSIHAI